LPVRFWLATLRPAYQKRVPVPFYYHEHLRK
jgi:hypothetical protein